MKPLTFPLAWATLSALAFASTPLIAQDEPADQEAAEAEFFQYVEDFGWEREGVGKVGKWAEIQIPEGFRYTDGDGARKLMEVYGNTATDIEQGLLAPENLDWFVIFEFDKSGYVKDDEKDEINPEKLLKELQKGQEQANVYREQNGMEKLHLTGWHTEPFYNESTNNLEWALLLEDESGNEIVNYKTKILGRYGVMDSILVIDPSLLDGVLPDYQNILADYSYVPGNTYAEYQEGDKLAKYGLTALIVGGGSVAAAKLGLFAVIGKFLAKAWKLVVAAVVGVIAMVKRFFGGGGRRYGEE